MGDKINVVIPSGTPITQFLPEGGVEVREFTPEVIDALKSIKIKGVKIVDEVVAKIMGHAPSFVKDFTNPNLSPQRERIPGVVLKHDVHVEVQDGKLKVTELI